MSQQEFRVNLADSSFPMLSTEVGRTVLVSSFSAQPSGEQSARPQVLYMHNVMPTKRGVVSVGYEGMIPPVTDLPVNGFIKDVRIIYSETGERVHLGLTDTNAAYTLEPGSTIWKHPTDLFSGNTDIVTLGTVNGVTYIYVTSVGAFTYNSTASTFTSVTLTGLGSGVIGVAASSGYLIAFTDRAIAWSSTIDPTDFVPSTVTGAGGGNVADIEGSILFVVPNTLGLLIYTAANTVAATYTGNRKFPFKFRAVDNSRGALALDQVAYETTASDHFAYTKGGLQTVNSRISEIVLPEVTDFLAGEQLEDFDEVTSTLSTTDLTTTLLKKIKIVGSRYLIVSYGITEFTHAMIYDIALKKSGKLKITHTDVFSYLGDQQEIGKQSIAFILKDGTIKVLKFSVPSTNRIGVLILGRYTYVRDRSINLHKVTVENVGANDVFSFTDWPSLDGRNTATPVTFMETIRPNSRDYLGVSHGKNHMLLFQGQFNLSTLEIKYTVGGKV